MEKLFKDRLNCLKSRLKTATSRKLTKIIDNDGVTYIEGQIYELKYLARKLNIEL